MTLDDDHVARGGEPSKWGHRIVTQMSVTELAADSFAPVAMLCFSYQPPAHKNGIEPMDSNRLARSCSSLGSPLSIFTFINFFYFFFVFFFSSEGGWSKWRGGQPTCLAAVYSSAFFFFFCLSSFENDVSSLKASRRARGEGLPPGGGDFFFGWAGGGGRFYSSEEPTCLG